MRIKRASLIIALPLILSGCASEGFNTEQALVAGASALQAATLDEDTVKQMAGQAAQEMDSKNQVAPANSAYAKRLAAITQGLESSEGLSLNFKVYQSEEINAFAMPDGTVRVYSGLLDAMPDDQVLAVIQHEIGHVKLKHSYNQMRKQLLTNAAFGAAAAAGGQVGALTSSQLGQLAYGYVNARFSQADELESDAYAVKSLNRLGKDPAAMKRAIQTLQSKNGSGGSFLASHPSNEKRLENIEATIKRLK